MSPDARLRAARSVSAEAERRTTVTARMVAEDFALRRLRDALRARSNSASESKSHTLGKRGLVSYQSGFNHRGTIIAV